MKEIFHYTQLQVQFLRLFYVKDDYSFMRMLNEWADIQRSNTKNYSELFELLQIRVVSLRSKIGEFINNLLDKDMYLTTEKKQDFFKTFGSSELDTGSAEGQIALFSYRIAHLTEHLKKNKKDFSTQRALIRLVSKRRHLLDYLKLKDIIRYREIIKALNLRK